MRLVAASRAVLLLVACACQRPGSPSSASDRSAPGVTGSSIADTVRSLEHAWAEAVRTRDSTVLERLVAPEFVVSGAAPSQPPLARAVWMENTLHRLRVDSIRLSRARVAVQGDTAVATLSFVWAGQFMTTPPFRDSTELTDTWVRRAGVWRVHRRVLSK